MLYRLVNIKFKIMVVTMFLFFLLLFISGCSLEVNEEYLHIGDNNKNMIIPNETIKGNSIVEPHITLDEIAKMVGIKSLHNSGFTGKGITIAVLDSGVYEHDDLIKPNNRIIAFKDFVNDISLPYDDNGHGTAVTGIIAGNGYSNKINAGIAPESKIIMVKVLDRNGNVKFNTLINGLNWVIDNSNKYNIRILNLSLGLIAIDENERHKLMEVIEKIRNKGILVITSVGNIYNNKPIQYFPAISNKVIAVGSIGDMSFDKEFRYKVAKFSSYWINDDGSTKPDLLAPGNNILSLKSDIYYKPNANSLKIHKNKSEYIISSGTSESSAVVAGIAAVFMQQYPQKSSVEIKKLLETRCIRLKESNEKQGHGFIYIK